MSLPFDVEQLEPRMRVIVALDVNSAVRAQQLVKELVGAGAVWFKVGRELIDAQLAGQVSQYVYLRGGSLFWDGKLHDIPNTVASAVRQTVALHRVGMLSVMAAAGPAAMQAAVAEAGRSWMIAVTVPTSMGDQECGLVYRGSVEGTVHRLASMAEKAGCNGIVCSPADLRHLVEFPHLIKVTPGTRPVWAGKNDQTRVMTPGQAVRSGSHFLVMGRPITRPPEEVGSPAEAFRRVVEEIAEAA